MLIIKPSKLCQISVILSAQMIDLDEVVMPEEAVQSIENQSELLIRLSSNQISKYMKQKL